MTYIKKLQIENFGPIKKLYAEFQPKGVTAILGNNASGKTQLIGAILFSIIGKELVNTNDSSDLRSIVKVELSNGITTQGIVSTVLKNNGKQHVFQEITPSGIGLQEDLKKSMLDKPTPNIFLGGENPELKLPESLLTELDSMLTALNINMNEERLVDIFLKKERIASEGERRLIKLLLFYKAHKASNIPAPLIIDEWINTLDFSMSGKIYELLFELGKHTQVIFTGFSLPKMLEAEGNNFQIIHLEYDKENPRSPISYNYNYHVKRILQDQLRTNEDRHFILGETVDLEEGMNVEFKEVKGTNAIGSIKSLADQYVVAFLNSKSNQGGRIIWGISNDERKVTGVKFSYKERDEIKRTLTEDFLTIQPQIYPSAFSINFHPIYDGTDKIEDVYLLEIIVPPVHSIYLHATSKNEVYIKTVAGKKKLSMLQVQKELEERIKSSAGA